MAKGLFCGCGQNNILSTLPNADQALIMPLLEPVRLDRDMVLEEPRQPVRFVYFPTSGVASTVAFSKSGGRIEVGLFGREGMSGTAVMLQTGRSSNQTFMQIPGEGLMIKAADLRKLLEQRPALQRHMLRYVQTLMTQASRTALSNGQSKLEARLARWLLMCHDRINGDEVSLTHKLLSIMLGVRRAGVTVAIHMLESKGLIRANRGQIIILDRTGLEKEVGDSYGAPEAEYACIIGFGDAEQMA